MIQTMKQKSVRMLSGQTALRIALFLVIAAVPAFAQGPFAATVTSIQTFALFFARAFAVVAVIIGGAVATVGGHRAEGIMAIILGVGMMAEAQNLVSWLFV